MKIKKYIVTAIIIILFAVFFSPQDVLLVKGERKNILVFPYKDKIDFTIEYTHSVEKTSTSETFRAYSGKENIVLLSTKFVGQGAGLPSEIDKNFKHQDNFFIVDNINLHSTVKCNARSGDFIRCFKSKTFSWSVI